MHRQKFLFLPSSLKFYILLWLLCFVKIGNGQNLVLNPSFEEVKHCERLLCYPSISSVINQDTGLIFWTRPNFCSPDLLCQCFDTCGYYWDSIDYNVPNNMFGTQMPHSGNNYAGFGVYWIQISPLNLREYIQGNLSQKLIANKKYSVKFYLSLSDTSYYAIKSIGIDFSFSERFYFLNATPLSIAPQLVYNQFLYDKTNWMELSFNYIASGGEQFFIIGNFNNDANTDTLVVKWPVNYGNSGSYYYIDDVSVVFNDTIYKANAGRDTTICNGKSTTLGTQNFNDYHYKWFPSTSLNNDTMANPIASPSITTTYILELKDFFDTLTYDTVVVHVIPCEPANAGADQSICPNQSIELGTHNYAGYTYTWSPINGLDNPNIANPTAAPVANITYTLTVIDLLQTLSKDEVQITIKDCDTTNKEIIIPNVFTPNNDGYNDYFFIENIRENTQLIIFNRWGNKVFESNNYQNNWNGNNVSAGVYYYVINLANSDSKQGVIEVIK